MRRLELLRPSTFVAFLAAVMLMIGGASAQAATGPCNPCPPDCPMMMQMARAAADHHGRPPGKAGGAENPCKQALACQASFAGPVLSDELVMVAAAGGAADHVGFDPLAARSHPPDRTLRPPIQL
jgi:hypothetical protein